MFGTSQWLPPSLSIREITGSNPQEVTRPLRKNNFRKANSVRIQKLPRNSPLRKITYKLNFNFFIGFLFSEVCLCL